MKKWLIAFGSVLSVVVLVAFLYSDVQQRRLKEQAAIGRLTLQAQVGKLRAALPVGTSENLVAAYLTQSSIPFYVRDSTLHAELGSVPSTVWYCSRWATYVEFTFERDTTTSAGESTLQNLTSAERGIDCM